MRKTTIWRCNSFQKLRTGQNYRGVTHLPIQAPYVPAIGYECSCWDDLTWPQNLTESTCRTTYLKLNLKNQNINSKSTSVPLSDWNKPCNHQLHWTSTFQMSQPLWNHLLFSHSKTTTWSQVTPSIISAVFPFWSAFVQAFFLAPSGFLSFWGWVQTDKQGSGPLASREGNSFKLRFDFFESRRQITNWFHFSNYS